MGYDAKGPSVAQALGWTAPMLVDLGATRYINSKSLTVTL